MGKSTRKNAERSERNMSVMPARERGPVVDMASRMWSWTSPENVSDPEAVRRLVRCVAAGNVSAVWGETKAEARRVVKNAEDFEAFVAAVAEAAPNVGW